ncbi:restriction endonuclease subunit S [Corynebacterium amycolatum]|uniref:restriction endonuclease subunit S n=1 Tax=Corynebacterium amycolatum TaxID=43765 RepID=UPI001920018C|nr:restriction endonuclease subunit S [Corynebacterium amycolatum]QQU99006.1 restriction endonuclease subunit S [Corynebacterium amycolatum]QQU99962.1 restriction endonuclease subunit S [Corynebacterium amycolatum]
MLLGQTFEINPKVLIPRNESVEYVSMDQIEPGRRDVFAVENRPFKSGSTFCEDDVLMARITPCLENGKIAVFRTAESSPAAGSTEFLIFREKPGVSITPFICYRLRTPIVHETTVSLMSGTSGRQRVDKAAFADTEILLPPLSTQNGITDVLGTLDDKITVNTRVFVAVEKLVSALYRATPKTDSALTFDDVAEIFGGRTPSTKNADFWDGAVQWAAPTAVTAVQGPWILDTSRKISEEGLRNSSGRLHPPGSILMTSRATIGQVVLTDKLTTTNQGFINLVCEEQYRY